VNDKIAILIGDLESINLLRFPILSCFEHRKLTCKATKPDISRMLKTEMLCRKKIKPLIGLLLSSRKFYFCAWLKSADCMRWDSKSQLAKRYQCFAPIRLDIVCWGETLTEEDSVFREILDSIR